LNERGREQAAALGKALLEEYQVTTVRSSDLPRASETAAALADPLGLEIEFDSRWRERDFGFCQGLTYEEFGERFPALSTARSGIEAVDARPESGETIREMAERVRAAFEDVVAETGTEDTTIVVTHGGPLYTLLGRLKGLDLAESISDQTQDNCTVNEIDVEDEPRIVRDNYTDLWK
jgi:probable phosphoglycerate mutase